MQKKLKITGLDDPQGKGTAGKEFTLQLNPETYKHQRALAVPTKEVGDTAGPVGQFKGYGEETMSIDFYVDGTGAIPGTTGTCDAMLKDLEETIYDFDSSQHKPRFLLIEYGSFVFRCMLTSFNIDCVLFDIDGSPVRAKVSLATKGAKEEKTTKSSPDMTHAITIVEGDSLPLLCKKVYGKMDYYLQVAQHNGLTNFRELEIGSVVEFPPLQR
jgi:nucleoid-associated protein YgaU